MQQYYFNVSVNYCELSLQMSGQRRYCGPFAQLLLVYPESALGRSVKQLTTSRDTYMFSNQAVLALGELCEGSQAVWSSLTSTPTPGISSHVVSPLGHLA
eukprot:gnl/TRDRNA2_/TRDRNA2_129770_c0_seq2.p1 gnl/TRDRNA2_/TRDRNA2_129770_c0~~gnl/TRDRNA2_/TRDRNA2_129770_c0_seq2.p1  ORF type:complete len:100 (+),score=2.12 gnl/TRDRNA2_/TRDRNA2_129770_c0_seq2:2-301(+)